MHFRRVGYEIAQVDIGFIPVVVDGVRAVQNYQSSPLMPVESALDRRHRVLHLHYLLTRICLPIIEESVDLDIVALDRLLRFSFDPEHGSVVPSIFADVVQHQLRLTRSIEPPQHQDPHVFYPVILEIVQLFFDLLVQSRSRDEVGDRSERRVGIVTPIGAWRDLGSSRRIWAFALALGFSVLIDRTD